MFLKCDIFNNIFSFEKIKKSNVAKLCECGGYLNYSVLLKVLCGNSHICHDVKSACLTKVLFFDKCVALKIPKHVSGVIGSLLYFKKQIDNGVSLYESISADSDVHIFIPVLYSKTQVLLLATFFHRSC
jgi:hypothetical protein